MSEEYTGEGQRPKPYLWRYREEKADMELDILLLPTPGDTFPEEKGVHEGETTIVWWNDE